MDCIWANLNQLRPVRDAKCGVGMILFVIKIHRKRFLCYHLPCSLKTFIKVFAFLCIKANSKEIFFLIQKITDVSIFVEIS